MILSTVIYGSYPTYITICHRNPPFAARRAVLRQLGRRLPVRPYDASRRRQGAPGGDLGLVLLGLPRRGGPQPAVAGQLNCLNLLLAFSRGKPLMLSTGRLQRLRRDWLLQAFEPKWFSCDHLPQMLNETHLVVDEQQDEQVQYSWFVL